MKCVIALVLAWSLISANAGLSSELQPPPEGWPSLEGLLGLESEDGHGWLAIKVDFGEDAALAGFVWYNNDELVTFPTVSVGTGYDSGPGDIVEALTIAQSIYGQSEEWSVCEFEEPVAASLSGLYVVLEFPAGMEYSEPGTGGGAAVGYSYDLPESRGWISGDGETWHPLSSEFGFAIVPILVPMTDGMLVKSLEDGSQAEALDLPDQVYVTAGPNPFNPAVTVRYGLPETAQAHLYVYDVRGRKIATLVDELLEAGHFEVTWTGRDDSGRQQASGVYFLRLSIPGEDSVQRVTLVK